MKKLQTTLLLSLGITLFCLWEISHFSPKLSLYPNLIEVKESSQNMTLVLKDSEVRENNSSIEKSKIEPTNNTISTNESSIHSIVNSSSIHPPPSPSLLDEQSLTSNKSISNSNESNLNEIDVTILRYNNYTTNDCFRHCSNNMSNKIYYGCAIPNGLGDRQIILTSLANLAGYLCATVELPKPAIMLHPKHNHNQTVSETLTWDDFFQYSFNDNYADLHNQTQTQKQTQQQQQDDTVPLPPIINDVDVMDYPLEASKTISCRNPKERIPPAYNNSRRSQPNPARDEIKQKQSIEFITTFQQDKFNDDFDAARRLSLEFDHHASFIWTIDVGWYSICRLIDEHLRQLQLETPTKQLYLPSTSCSYSSVKQPNTGQAVCSYSSVRQAIKVQAIIDTLWDMMIRDYSSANSSSSLLESHAGTDSIQNYPRNPDLKIGYFHLRRGDTSRVCDTTLTRMDSYINCTFSKENLARNDNRHQFYKISGIDSSSTTTPLLLLFGTDETDPDYINGIEQIFVQHHPHLKLIHADAIVQKYLQEESSSEPDSPIPSSYLNNYHIFSVLNGFISKADFVVQQRRAHCKKCDMIKWKAPKMMNSKQ